MEGIDIVHTHTLSLSFTHTHTHTHTKHTQIEKTLVEGIGVSKTAVFFVEKHGQSLFNCFWTHDPKNAKEYLRYINVKIKNKTQRK